MKFKVGDVVIGNEAARKYYITKQKPGGLARLLASIQTPFVTYRLRRKTVQLIGFKASALISYLLWSL